MNRRVKFGFLAIFLFLSVSSVGLTAAPRRFGVGLVLIEPSGLTGKAWLGGSLALAGAIGWSAEENHYLHVHGDLLFLDSRLAGDRNLDLDFYLGVGGKIIFRDYDSAWFRVPLGLEFRLKKAPINIFFEVVPTFNFSEIKLLGAVGFRYLFSS